MKLLLREIFWNWNEYLVIDDPRIIIIIMNNNSNNSIWTEMK